MYGALPIFRLDLEYRYTHTCSGQPKSGFFGGWGVKRIAAVYLTHAPSLVIHIRVFELFMHTSIHSTLHATLNLALCFHHPHPYPPSPTLGLCDPS